MFDSDQRSRVSFLNAIRRGQGLQNAVLFAGHFRVTTFNVFKSLRRQSDGNPLNRLDDFHYISSILSIPIRLILFRIPLTSDIHLKTLSHKPVAFSADTSCKCLSYIIVPPITLTQLIKNNTKLSLLPSPPE